LNTELEKIDEEFERYSIFYCRRRPRAERRKRIERCKRRLNYGGRK